MRRRKKLEALLVATIFIHYLSVSSLKSEALLLLATNCLALTAGCSCSWRSGKYVADCNGLSLNQVPKNDYSEYLMSKAASNTERDIQQLNLAGNNISELSKAEFFVKKFGNLQKVNLNSNKLASIHPEAFHKLTGLIDLDLSENALTNLVETRFASDELNGTVSGDFEVGGANTRHRNSFLQSLSQLRTLNLNSNQLSRLDKFAFSPVAQLRQLYLSRNQISSIDKQAFDGLDVLNILHLDGNKLSCLDARILSQLPRLNAIQLASNQWQCDCHLRGLLRSLGILASSLGNGAPLARQQQQLAGGEDNSQGTRRMIQLVDEPACEQHNGLPRSSMTGDEEARKLWKNMRLSQFTCPPRPMEPLMGQPLALESRQEHVWELDAAALDHQIFSQKNMNMNDSVAPQTHPKASLVRFKGPQLTPGEPVELTCAHTLQDELELTEQTIEWWRIHTSTDGSPNNNNHRLATSATPELLWRSGQQASQLESVPSVDHNVKGDKVAVIDYVTRANSSTDLNKLDGGGGGQSTELVRVTHLLELPVDANHQIGGSAKPLYYLCRIANQIYGLHLLYRVEPSSNSSEALLEAQRRQSWRKAATEAATSNTHLRSLAPAKSQVELLARIQAFKHQLANSTKQVFVPILLPYQLEAALISPAGATVISTNTNTPRGRITTGNGGNNEASAPGGFREPQQRSTVSQRQTNLTTTMAHMQPQMDALDDTVRRLGTAAITLIHRYTSNRADLTSAPPPPPGLIQSNELQPVQVEVTSKDVTEDEWRLQAVTTSASLHNSWILTLKKSNHWHIAVALTGGGILLLGFLLSILLVSSFKRSMQRAEYLKRNEAAVKPSCGSPKKQTDSSLRNLKNKNLGEQVSPCIVMNHRKDIDEESNDADLDDSLRSHYAVAPLHQPPPQTLFMLSSRSSDSDNLPCTCQHPRQPPISTINNPPWCREVIDCLEVDTCKPYIRQSIQGDHQRPVKMIRFVPSCNNSMARVAPAHRQEDNQQRLEIACILNHKQSSAKEISYNNSSNSTSGCYEPLPTPNSCSPSHCDSFSGQLPHHSRCSNHQGATGYSQETDSNVVYLDEALRLLQYTVNEGSPGPAPLPPSHPFRLQNN